MTAKSARGYALFEAMISIFVVSVGFLGFAGTHIKALGTTNASLMRSKAVEFAYQASDRARANAPGALAGAYNGLTGTAADPGCMTSGCSANQMAQADYAEWRNQIGTALPGGVGVVCLDATPDDGDAASPQCDGAGSALVVKIFWTEKAQAYRLVNAFRP